VIAVLRYGLCPAKDARMPKALAFDKGHNVFHITQRGVGDNALGTTPSVSNLTWILGLRLLCLPHSFNVASKVAGRGIEDGVKSIPY
jgi:hypothetical protein